VARLWTLSAVAPQNGTSEGFAVMLVVTGEQVTQGTVPSCSPELTVVIDLTELGALVRAGGVGVEDAVLGHVAGA